MIVMMAVMKQTLCAAIIATVFAATATPTAEYHVAADGNDAHPGTLSQPFHAGCWRSRLLRPAGIPAGPTDQPD